MDINILEFHCPRFNELPKVPLYKDQVIIYIEDILKDINIGYNEKILTPTMINNYVKQKVVYPPKDKRYNENHLAYLIVVCILKQVFTLQEICCLIKKQIDTYPIEEAYDSFCNELEKSLKSVFITRDFSKLNSVKEVSEEYDVLKSAVISFANKVYIQKYINSELKK